MKAFFHRYATPFTTGLFLVSLVSGIALFLHIGPTAFRGMHEWLSMALILPFVLHLWRNWKPMTFYFKRPPMAVALIVSLVASALFFLPSGKPSGRGGPPQFAFTRAILNNPVSDVAPLVGQTAETLVAKLTAAGFVALPESLLSDLPAKAGKTEADLLRVLITGTK